MVSSPKPRGGNYLGNLEEEGVATPQMLMVGPEDLEGLGGGAVIVFKGPVES